MVIRTLRTLPIVHPTKPTRAIVEDTTMKMYRVVTFLAAVMLAVFFSWAVGHEHIGSQEAQAIEAAAP